MLRYGMSRVPLSVLSSRATKDAGRLEGVDKAGHMGRYIEWVRLVKLVQHLEHGLVVGD